MADREAAIRAVARHADHVYWVREWPDTPTWRDRFRRWMDPASYHFDRTATPPEPWVDRPAGHYERTGWRIRAAYVRSDLAFEVEYVVCNPCKIDNCSRNAEAPVTLGVTVAREGDLEQALIMGERAPEGDRQSVPSLIMTSRELAAEMRRRCSSEPAARECLGRLHSLAHEKPGFMPR
ncbi:hypothetical protein ABT065_19120 [Streptomyces sp. NPDC002764]|uniref:hypothetical protein n=1 Tax=Streptomyces sp. NPDC002764 TaxID=3154428 RepID=UPI003324D285